MYDISLNDNNLTFKSLEKEIYAYVCQLACNMFTYVLEELDLRLMAERDVKAYRSKGKKHTCIKTIMGSVEIDRRIYEFKTQEGKKAYKFLLDEYLGMDKIGHMSINLVESIISDITEVSYRKTAENIELMCNQSLSHTAVWDVVQKFGARVKESQERKVDYTSKVN